MKAQKSFLTCFSTYCRLQNPCHLTYPALSMVHCIGLEKKTKKKSFEGFYFCDLTCLERHKNGMKFAVRKLCQVNWRERRKNTQCDKNFNDATLDLVSTCAQPRTNNFRLLKLRTVRQHKSINRARHDKSQTIC